MSGKTRELRSGSYGDVPVMPVLTVNELAGIDVDGVVANAGLVATTPPRRRRKAERLARRQRVSWDQTLETEQPQREDGETLPQGGGLRRLSPRRYAPPLPWHMATVPQAGLLNPFGVGGYPPFDGPVIGRSAINGNIWRYDAWSPTRTGVASSVNGWVCGMPGSGKSMFLKAFASRETAGPWSRKVIIEGDPDNEWAAVARRVGGQVIEVGDGSYLNPLDPGAAPPDADGRAWAREALGLQRQALRSIASVLRPDRPFTSREDAMVSALLLDYSAVSRIPTISDMVALLQTDWPDRAEIRGLSAADREETANSLILLYDELVHGVESGAFERESTIRLDPESPMIVFNTGSVAGQNEHKKQLYMTAMSALVERLCARRDGHRRLVIAEEGHQLLSNPALVDAWEYRMRMSGHTGVSSWMLLHELSDLDKFAPEGSKERNKINSVLTLADVQVVYRQSEASLAKMTALLPDLNATELATLKDMGRYTALWRVGGKVKDLVTATLTPDEYAVMRNDRNR